MKNKVEICFIESFPSLMEGIFVLTGTSKSQIKKYLPKKYLAKKIRVGDEIHIPINIVNFGKINPIYLGPVIKTIFEDEQFLVVSKPKRVHCHPLGYNETDNILSYLYTIAPEILSVNPNSYDRGLFYRLDYETSGLLYFAKKTSIQNELRENFPLFIKEKNYLAIVSGKAKESDTLSHHLKTYGEKQAKVRVDEAGKLCECSYTRLDYNNDLNLSLVLVSLKQGFKHQIRVQMQAAGFSILGDPLYGNSKYDQMMLHCYQYKFRFNNTNYDLKDKSMELGDLFIHFHC